MVNVTYIETDERGIDAIKPLWEKLNEHHRQLSPHFAGHYETFKFEQRKADLLRKAEQGLMHIDLAKDMDDDVIVGYCVSTLIKDGSEAVGEVDSIYVDEAYRSSGIGDTLMRKALEWMDARGADVKRVSVGAGNEDVFPFYERYGFYPRMTVLQKIKK